MFIKLLIAIGLAWSIQGVFAFLQIKNFNKHFMELRKKGRVVIGRSRGKIRQGVVMLISIDSDCNIMEVRKMAGISVLSRFKTIDTINGENLHSIDKQKLNSLDRQTLLAVEDGINNYNEYYNSKNEDDTVPNTI